MAEQSKIIGEKWNALSEEEKKPFEELAAKERDEAARHIQTTPSIKKFETNSGNENEGVDEEGREEEEEEEENGPEVVTLPISRIKKMLKSDPECSNITGDAAFLITKATELFIELLAGECAAVADESGRKTINESDLGIAIHRVPALASILRADFPKLSRKEAEEIRVAKEKAKAEKKAALLALASVEENEKVETEEGGKDTMKDIVDGLPKEETEKIVPVSVPIEGGLRQGSLITMMARARELAAADPNKRIGSRYDDEDDDVIVIESSSNAGSKKASSSKGLMDRFAVSLKDPEEKRKFWADSIIKDEDILDMNDDNEVNVSRKKKVIKRKNKSKNSKSKLSASRDGNIEDLEKSNEEEIEEEEEEEEEEDKEEDDSHEARIMERIRRVQLEEEKQRKARLKARLKLTDADNQALEEEGDIDLGFIRQRVSGKVKRRPQASKKKPSKSTKGKTSNSSSSSVKGGAKKKTVTIKIDDKEEGDEIEDIYEDEEEKEEEEEEEEDEEEEPEPDRGRPDSALQVEVVEDLRDDDKVEEIDEDEDDEEED